MCGICGELTSDGRPAALDVINKMLPALASRGPDDQGTWQQGPLAFGHQRLSIIDLSQKAHQPMVDTQLALTIVFNGTIYNYPELRAQLQGLGHSFKSSGDTEVILKAYAEWGEECSKRLHGMFAFAIWDAQKQQLFMSRDRMGIKPLYYSANKKGIRFASNTQALLATGDIDTSLDPVALHHQFSLHAVVPAPRTILNGIRKLPPAHNLIINSNGKQQLKRYWQLTANTDVAMSDEDWIEGVQQRLIKAVERRIRIADVPVGVLLSGGLDSSLLVGLLHQAGVADIKTFSIGFEDHPEEKGNEFEYSDPLAAHFNTQHHKFHIPNAEVLPHIPDAVAHMAEPMVGQDAVAFYLLAERVAKEVKVVQSGQGADEVFAGYFWYQQMFDSLNGAGADAASKEAWAHQFKQFYFDRSQAEMNDLLAASDGIDHSGLLVADRLQQFGSNDFLDAVLRFDTTTLIVDDPVKRVDNMTMAWGLEARVPFLDQELVEFAANMPSRLKLSQGGKGPLKSIARGLIPDAVIDRPKAYFPMPALKYVRGEFYDFMHDILCSQAARERSLFNPAAIETLLRAPESHFTKLNGSKLWHCALLELWLQTHTD
ncbi:MAG: N-acetylglutaminylglutamine amidotransferase [Gammaproteobacteria bacterium]|nr:N-acetylglutaminylglutamine amidotransferase [Gammaproteobacteria bacterium]